ncbi:MAG TPA: glycosyltransferase family 39 protein, partial [Anaerolineae bacterium]
MSLRLSRTNWILLGIAAIAVFFRFYRLDTLPPGFQFDQAFYVFDVLRLLQGQFYLFFAAPGGSEPLYLYLATVGVSIFGDAALGLKLTSAVIGVLTVPLVYDVTRTFFQTPMGSGEESDDRATRIALLAALFAAISLWHIFFTRYGERVTLLVLLEILVFKFLWRALLPSDTSNQRERIRWRGFALAGLFTAMGLYTYVGSRVVPLALVLLTAYGMLTDRAHARVYFKGLLLAAAVIVVVFLPLGLYFVSHPDQFLSHSAEVSIFLPHGDVQSGVGQALLNNGMRLLGMFFVAGDGGNLRNVPGRPIFDPLAGALFVIGVLALLGALLSRRAKLLERRRAVFLLTWIGAALAISLLTDDAPNFVRTLPAMPAVMMLPAWGAVELWEHWRNPDVRRVAAACIGIIILTSAALAYRDYFIVFAQDPATYYTFDTDKVETSDWINRNAISRHLFLAPLWAQNGTISLLTRSAPLKSFESRDTIVLPSRSAGKDAVYGFPPEQDRKVQTMSLRLGGLGAVERLTGSNGAALLLIYRVPAANLPDPANPLDGLARGG